MPLSCPKLPTWLPSSRPRLGSLTTHHMLPLHVHQTWQELPTFLVRTPCPGPQHLGFSSSQWPVCGHAQGLSVACLWPRSGSLLSSETSQGSFLLPERSLLSLSPALLLSLLLSLGPSGLLPGPHPSPHPPWAMSPSPRLPLLTSVLIIPQISPGSTRASSAHLHLCTPP